MSVATPSFLPLPRRIVALHCSASGPAQWDAYRPLVDPSVRWTTPALQGYDDAGWPLGTFTSLAAEARRILPLLANSGGEVHLVGHSYGAAVALEVAATWPERVRSVTVYEPVLAHLLLQDAASTPLAAELRQVAAAVGAHIHAGRAADAAERFVDYWSGPGSWARAGSTRRAALLRRMPKVVAEFCAVFAAATDYSVLEALGADVRIVAGSASPLPVRRAAELLHRKLPQAAFQAVAGAGHMAPVQDAPALAPFLFPDFHVRPLARAA